MRHEQIAAIYCLAWEGGHHDHDASQLVAAVFAKARGLLEETREIPLYRGLGRRGPVFRVSSPLPGGRPWERRRIPLRDALRAAALPRHYRTQRVSWMALLPESAVKLLLMRRELVRPIDVSRYRHPPHRGLLYYERRFRFAWARFEDASRAFLDRYLDSRDQK